MPHVELPQVEFKVVMLGDTFTGKTSLVLRFAEGYYRESGRSATVGAFFITKRLTVHVLTCKIQIWDTAGQEQYKKLVPMYYKNAAAAIVCYDVTSPTSFETLKYWVDELRTNLRPGQIVMALCATKCDLENDSTDTGPAEVLAAEIGAAFYRTSAKENLNVNEVFERVAEHVLHCQQNGESRVTPITPSTTGMPTIHERNFSLTSPTVGFPQSTQPSRINPTTPGVHQSHADEKKDDREDELVDLVESKETIDSKTSCDASGLMCGGAEEMGGQGCIIL